MAKTIVRSDDQFIAPRCREIRERLDDFANDRLGPTATGEVRGHLVSCEGCSQVFGEMLFDAVERGDVPLLTSPIVPPLELYERSFAGESGPTWKTVRAKLNDANAVARAWASTRMEEIRAGFQLLVTPPGFAHGAIRTRGAVRVRGGRAPSSPATIAARVLHDPDPARTVAFDVRLAPAITADGRFTLELWTEASEYDGHRLVCTIALPGTGPLSFDGTIAPVAGQTARRVVIDEEGVPAPPLLVPTAAVRLAID